MPIMTSSRFFHFSPPVRASWCVMLLACKSIARRRMRTMTTIRRYSSNIVVIDEEECPALIGSHKQGKGGDDVDDVIVGAHAFVLAVVTVPSI